MVDSLNWLAASPVTHAAVAGAQSETPGQHFVGAPAHVGRRLYEQCGRLHNAVYYTQNITKSFENMIYPINDDFVVKKTNCLTRTRRSAGRTLVSFAVNAIVISFVRVEASCRRPTLFNVALHCDKPRRARRKSFFSGIFSSPKSFFSFILVSFYHQVFSCLNITAIV